MGGERPACPLWGVSGYFQSNPIRQHEEHPLPFLMGLLPSFSLAHLLQDTFTASFF